MTKGIAWDRWTWHFSSFKNSTIIEKMGEYFELEDYEVDVLYRNCAQWVISPLEDQSGLCYNDAKIFCLIMP